MHSWHFYSSTVSNQIYTEQGRIQDFKLGGRGAVKKIAPSGGRRENFWGISCEKSRFYAKKKHIFSNFRGGARRVRPPWIRPCRAPFEKNILVMLPILDDVAQSQNILIYRRYDFFIAKHVEPGRGSAIFSCSCAIFRHNFSNSIPVIFFYFIKNKEVPHAQELHHSFIHHWKLFSNDLSQPRKRKTKMCRPWESFEDVKSD